MLEALEVDGEHRRQLLDEQALGGTSGGGGALGALVGGSGEQFGGGEAGERGLKGEG